MLQSFAKPVVNGLMVAIPVVITTTQKAYGYYSKLPQNAMLFVTGSIFCFFGGTFPVLFAAVQAAEYSGRQAVVEAVSDLADEALIIIEESKKDNKKDDDNDGKADVDQISNAEFVARKTKLVLKKMNPEKVDKAVASIYKVWLAVAAVLSVEFARTISMAMAISDFVKRPLNRFVAPTIQAAVPDEYDKWVPTVLGWIAKSVAISIAFWVQSVVSGCASALKGGLMMAQATYQALAIRNIDLFGLISSKDHNDSSLDEGLSYVFAALGFYSQFRVGFAIPTLLKPILWPFKLAEYYLRWSVTKSVKA